MDKTSRPAFRRNLARMTPSHFLRKTRDFLREDTRGAAAVMTALTLPVLVGIVGLAVDASLWMGNKSMAQGASDNAGRALLRAVTAGDPTSQAKQVAYDVATANGYENGVGGVTVTITGPTSGAYLVEISQPQSLFFGILAMPIAPTVRVQTSVLTPFTAGPPCVLALDAKPDSGTLSVWGNSTVSTSGCPIGNNSTSATGTTVGGAGVLTTTDQFKTPGNYTGHLTAAEYLTGSSAYVTADPFAGLPTVPPPLTQMPPPGVCTALPTSGALMTPGTVYCTGTVHTKLTLSPGAYIFNGDGIKNGSELTVNGPGSIDGSAGVTLIFLNAATIKFDGFAEVTLNAPTSGTYKGVAIYDDYNPSGPVTSFGSILGGAAVSINGAVYVPHQSITYSGTSAATCTKLIAYQVSFTGTSAFTDNATCHDGNGTTSTASGIY